MSTTSSETVDEEYTDEQPLEFVEIEIIESANRKTFKVGRVFLFTNAPTFAALFGHPSIQKIAIKGTSIKTFKRFLSWLNFNHAHDPTNTFLPDRPYIICISNEDVEKAKEGSIYREPLLWYDLKSLVWGHAEIATDMFIFAEEYGIKRLRQDAIDRFAWCLQANVDGVYDTAAFLSPNYVCRIYEHSQPNGALRQLVAAAYCVLLYKSKVALSDYPKEYLVDVPHFREKVSPESWKIIPAQVCNLHKHETKEEKNACRIRVKARS